MSWIIGRTHRLEDAVETDGIGPEDGERAPPSQELEQEEGPRHDMPERQALGLLGEVGVAQQVGRADGGVDPAAQAHRLKGQHQVLEQQVGLDLGAHRTEGPERDLQVLVEKPAADPAPDAGGLIEVPVVDEHRAVAVGLGEHIHQGVDVLPRHVDDRQEDRAPFQVGEEPVRVEVVGEMAGEIEPLGRHADLRQLGAADHLLGRRRVLRTLPPRAVSLRRK